MSDLNDLELLIKSQTPIIVIESHEEQRVLALFREVALKLRLPVTKWSVTNGLQRLEHGFLPQKFNTAPADVLGHLRTSDLPGLYVMLDFHPYLENPLHVRLIREIAEDYPQIPKLLVFLSPQFPIPHEFSAKTARFQIALPNREQILDIIKGVAAQWSNENVGRKVAADRKAVELLARNLSGLTSSDVERLARKAIYNDGAITQEDLSPVMAAKYELINQNGVLSFEYETSEFGEVGGLENLKRWLNLRKTVFHGAGGQYGLDAPKGLLLLGVQGCGKSLAAKAIAGVWSSPLLRLDFGALYNKYVGETERNLRESLKMAEVMAPCILWIDEIEKGLAGGSGDDGVSRRTLGTLLTWMAEKVKPVFVVATANDVTTLPPELLRKGRFDEIFFVDLPSPSARATIFGIQLRRRKLREDGFNLTRLAAAAQGFSGAEIEQVVVSSLYSAIAQQIPLNEAHILSEIQNTRPLSVLMAERVAELRHWAASRTIKAD